MRPSTESWGFVVPVKRLALAKTRLDLDSALRAELALAMAVDTVRACVTAGLGAVVVVTDDTTAAEAMLSAGAQVVPDAPDAGLNPALRHGAETVARLGMRGVAALASDLPALTGEAVHDIVRRAASLPTAVVADDAGTGTTLLAARDVRDFAPAFGADSRRRHVEAGAADISDVADPTLRRDVDTLADLAAACALGCGAATRAVLASHPDLGG